MKVMFAAGALGLLACASIAGCGQRAEPPAASTPVAVSGQIAFSEPRVRMPPGGRDVTAAYLTVTNAGPTASAIMSASSPDVERIELHAHLEGPDGVMQMRTLERIDLPAGQTILLAPQGLHLMLFGVKPEAVERGSLPLTLVLDGGASVSFEAHLVANPVRQGAHAEAGHEHDH